MTGRIHKGGERVIRGRRGRKGKIREKRDM